MKCEIEVFKVSFGRQEIGLKGTIMREHLMSEQSPERDNKVYSSPARSRLRESHREVIDVFRAYEGAVHFEGNPRGAFTYAFDALGGLMDEADPFSLPALEYGSAYMHNAWNKLEEGVQDLAIVLQETAHERERLPSQTERSRYLAFLNECHGAARKLTLISQSFDPEKVMAEIYSVSPELQRDEDFTNRADYLRQNLGDGQKLIDSYLSRVVSTMKDNFTLEKTVKED